MAARGGELGAPGGCADHRTCSHVRNCRCEDEGVGMARSEQYVRVLWYGYLCDPTPVAICGLLVVAVGRPRIPAMRPRPQTVPRQVFTNAFPLRLCEGVESGCCASRCCCTARRAFLVRASERTRWGPSKRASKQASPKVRASERANTIGSERASEQASKPNERASESFERAQLQVRRRGEIHMLRLPYN